MIDFRKSCLGFRAYGLGFRGYTGLHRGYVGILPPKHGETDGQEDDNETETGTI